MKDGGRREVGRGRGRREAKKKWKGKQQKVQSCSLYTYTQAHTHCQHLPHTPADLALLTGSPPDSPNQDRPKGTFKCYSSILFITTQRSRRSMHSRDTVDPPSLTLYMLYVAEVIPMCTSSSFIMSFPYHTLYASSYPL